MTEAELLAEVTSLANDLGIWWHHCPDGRYCDGHPGLTDLLLVGRRGGMFAELKGEDGRRSMPQVHFGDLLMRAGFRYELWSPSSWRAGRVREKLRAIA